MVGGEEEASRFRDESINEDYDVQLRLTEADRRDVEYDLAACTCRHRAAGWCGSTTL